MKIYKNDITQLHIVTEYDNATFILRIDLFPNGDGGNKTTTQATIQKQNFLYELTFHLGWYDPTEFTEDDIILDTINAVLEKFEDAVIDYNSAMSTIEEHMDVCIGNRNKRKICE